MAALNVLQPLKYNAFLYCKGEFKFSCSYRRDPQGRKFWEVVAERDGCLPLRAVFDDMAPKRLQKTLVETYIDSAPVAPVKAPEPAPAPAKGRGRPAARGKVAGNIVAVRFTDREYDLLLRACQPGESCGQMLRRLALTL